MLKPPERREEELPAELSTGPTTITKGQCVQGAELCPKYPEKGLVAWLLG